MVTWFWRRVPHRMHVDPVALLRRSRLVCRRCKEEHR